MPIELDSATLYAQLLSLLRRGFGHALWDPTHNDPGLPGPQIGSVGYVSRGKWVEILKIEMPPNARISTSPLNHRNLIISQRRTETNASMKVGVEALYVYTYISSKLFSDYVVHSFRTPISGGTGVEWSCSKVIGAVLALGRDGIRKDVENSRYLKDCILENFGEWMKTATAEADGVTLDQLILVTGVTYGAEWANAVVRAESASVKLKITMGLAGVVNGEFSLGITTEEAHRNWVEQNYGPRRQYVHYIMLFHSFDSLICSGTINKVYRWLTLTS